MGTYLTSRKKEKNIVEKSCIFGVYVCVCVVCICRMFRELAAPELTESAGVIVANGFGVPEGFQDDVAPHKDVFHVLRRGVGSRGVGGRRYTTTMRSSCSDKNG